MDCGLIMLKILISVVIIIVLSENIAVTYDLGDKDEAFIEQVDQNCTDTMAEELKKRMEVLEGNMIANKEKIKALEDENRYLRFFNHCNFLMVLNYMFQNQITQIML